MRRARRLLPALYTLLIVVTLYTTLFRRDALGQLRGDVIAALTYTTNWYQIWVGQGYTAVGRLRPVAPPLEPGRGGAVLPAVAVGDDRLDPARAAPTPGPQPVPVRSPPSVVTVLMALLYYPGPIATCEITPDAYWQVGRPLHLQDGHAVPGHAHPIRWAAARRRVRHGVAAGGHHAQPDADEGAHARRPRARRPGRLRRAVLVPLPHRAVRSGSRGCSAAASSSAGSSR